MGSMEDVSIRKANSLNTNRQGPLKEILAVIDRDIEGNEILLRLGIPGQTATQYLICSDERVKQLFRDTVAVIKHNSRRNLRIVKFKIVEE